MSEPSARGGEGLERFLGAQEADGSYRQALAELRAGRKRSHWIWFVFPQLTGLGRSPTARHFGIASLDEARAYLSHPLLGPRLLECSAALLAHADASAVSILGAVDAVKLRSSATLFAQADPAEACFRRILGQFFEGRPDPLTLNLLRAGPATP